VCLHLDSTEKAVILEESEVQAGVRAKVGEASSQVRDGPIWRYPCKLVNMVYNFLCSICMLW